MYSTRRRLFRAGALSLVPGASTFAAQAQVEFGTSSPPTPEMVRNVHSAVVSTAVAVTPPGAPLGQEALETVVRILRAQAVITDAERDFFFRLIKTIVTAESHAKLSSSIQALVKAFDGKVTELEQIVVAVMESSIDRARQLLERIEWPRLRDVIARDARGALDGMWVGYEYARMPGALIGAAIGAGAGSIPAFLAVAA